MSEYWAQAEQTDYGCDACVILQLENEALYHSDECEEQVAAPDNENLKQAMACSSRGQDASIKMFTHPMNIPSEFNHGKLTINCCYLEFLKAKAVRL